MSKMVSGQGKSDVENMLNIYTIKCSVCGFFLSWHEAILEVWIFVTRFDDGVNYHLNCNHLLWRDQSRMVLKTVFLLAPPLSIWHALATQTCTHFDWAASQHWLTTDLDVRLKPCHHYRSSTSLLALADFLLNRLQVMNWLWLLITNSALNSCLKWFLTWKTFVFVLDATPNPESHNHFITGNNDRSTGGKKTDIALRQRQQK